MIKKKFLLVALMIATVFIAEAQVSSTGGYDWRDSSLVPPSRMEQHYEFMNNQYNFPAKPRSQWEIGVKVGAPMVNGDVDASFPGIGFGVHARKSLGYLVSLRGGLHIWNCTWCWSKIYFSSRTFKSCLGCISCRKVLL